MLRRFTLVALLVVAVCIAAVPAQSAPNSPLVGCKLVGKKKVGKSFLFHTTVAAVRTRVSFCFNGNQVLRPQAWCEVLSHDAFTVTNNGCDIQQGYIAWRGNPNGGYAVQATYSFGGCVLHYGCFGSYTYNMHIEVHADGTWIHN